MAFILSRKIYSIRELLLLINRIIRGDCLEFMKKLPDKSIDLILTDPPYGINIAKSGNVGGGKLAPVKDYGARDWDNEIPSQDIFREMFRVSKNQIIFGGNYFVEHLYNSSCWIVWDKNNTGNFADCELAWTSFKTAVRKFEYTWNGFIQGDMKNKEERIHPTQKPLPLFEWILNNYSEEGQTIYDPFGGSGTTAVACHRLNRNFMVTELDEEYYNLSVERLEKERNQASIFDFI